MTTAPQIPAPAERRALLEPALAALSASRCYPGTDVARLGATLDGLFAFVLTPEDLPADVAETPVEHPATVLAHMMEIAAGEGFGWDEVRRAAAASLLHDIWPIQRITREMRRAAATDAEREELERIAKARREEHMARGRDRARERLEAFNAALPPDAGPFTPEDIEAVAALIAVHDNPSIGAKILPEDRLAVAFREADRLWMLTPQGLRGDLARKGIAAPTDGDMARQAEANLESFRQERGLYGPGDGTFRDGDTFFRTRSGHALYLRLWAGLQGADGGGAR
jgi:hypothetical protein